MSLDLEPINELHRKIQEKLSSMISAKDLRIGNKIYLELGLPGLNVHEVMPQDIADIANGRITPASIEGIRLSEEWLNKCGFDKGQLKHKDPQFWLEVDVKSGIIEIGDVQQWEHSWIEISVQYLHQLQNLYYALTGEELTIQP
jgi:hypothetical protein